MLILSESKQTLIKRLFFLLLFFLVVTAFYLGVSLKIPYNSDQASFLMYTKSILDGNILLKGWSLSTVSYYTTEVPFFILGLLIFGFTEKVIYIITAINYSALVLLIVYICAFDENGYFSIKKALISFSLTFILAFIFSRWGLLSPDHLVAYSYIIICFLSIRLIEKNGKAIYYGIYAFFLVLTVIGDSFSLYILVVPLIIVSLLNLLREGPKRTFILLLITTCICVLFSKGILKVIEISGGFTVPGIGNSELRFVEFSSLGNSFNLFFYGLLDLFGVDLFGKAVYSLDTVFGLIHLGGLCLFLLTLYVGIKKIGKQTFESQIMIVAILMNLLEYLFGSVAIDRTTVRYLVPSLLFGIILITSFVNENPYVQRKPILLFFSCFVLIVSSFPPISFSRPLARTNKLSSFLLDHHLEYGYAGYWNASIITVHTQGKVSVRPVIAENGWVIQPYHWLSEDSWYQNSARFIIIDKDNSFNISYRSGTNTFGTPDIIYTLDDYTIFVWNRNISSSFSTTQ